MKKIHIFIVIILSIYLSACQNKVESVNSEEKFSAEILKLSNPKFSVGDTLSITGRNFGRERGSHFIEFSGNDVDEPTYLSWSDTLIKVIVPKKVTEGSLTIKMKISNAFDYELKRHLLIIIIDQSVNLSLFITLIFLYLRINKIWKRKHEREVADSQSLVGLFMYIANCILWVLYYILVQPDKKSMIDSAIYIFEGSIYFIIGTGIWVKGQKRIGLWNLIKQALRLERKEANYLLKRFFKPQNADVIISILHQLAMIDEHLDDREREMISLFAKEWSIDYSIEKLNKERLKGTENNYIRLRSSVLDYLDREPPTEQVAQLKDMVQALIQADDKVTKEEELISSELMGIVDNFLSKDNKLSHHLVIIVPQRPEHEARIKELLPESTKIQTAGGIAYSIGSFYSLKYAEMICRQFRKYNLFTIVHSPEDIEPINLDVE